MNTDPPHDGRAGVDASAGYDRADHIGGGDLGGDVDDGGDLGEVVRFDVVGYGDKAAVLHVIGEIDTLTAPLVRAQLEHQVPAVPLLVLDLTEVTFLGSAGLAVLVAAKDDADLRQHRLRLVPGSRIVVRALQATGLLTIFDVVDSVREGLGEAG
jgi:anti-sigma B factor antagonist